MPRPTDNNAMPTIDLDAMPTDPGQAAQALNAPPTDVDLMAAMDAGIAGEPMPEVTPPEPAAKPDGAPADGDKPAGEPASDDPASIPGTPEHAAAAAAKKKTDDEAAAAAAAQPETPEAQAEAARRAEVDKEADALGIRNEKTRKRFHELNDQVAKAAPAMAMLEKVGVKDIAGVEQLIGNAQAAVDIVGMVQATGAEPQQYVMALDYLKYANDANTKGDLGAAAKCYDWLLEEIKHLGGMLGRELPGVLDPLAAHPDLQADLEDERITRERALEIVQARAHTTVKKTLDERQTTARQQADTEAAAVNEGRTALTALGNELSGANPAQYRALYPQLKDAIAEIATEFPPSQWAAATRLAYKQLARTAQAAPAPAAAKPAAPAGNEGPVRSSGPRPPMHKEFDNPLDALDAGINDADAGH